MVTATETQTPIRCYELEHKVVEQLSYLRSLGPHEATRQIREAPPAEYLPEALVLLAREYLGRGQPDAGWGLLKLLAARVSRRVKKVTSRMLAGASDRAGFYDDLLGDLMVAWASMEAANEFWAVRFNLTFQRAVTSACKRERTRICASLDDRLPGDAGTVGERMAAQEPVSIVDTVVGKQALAALPENHRMAFVLSRLNQLTELEIAVALGVTDRTVRNYLRAAEEGLARWIAGDTRIPT